MDAQSLGDAPSHPPDPTDWIRIVERSTVRTMHHPTVHLTAVGRGRGGREGMHTENENCGGETLWVGLWLAGASMGDGVGEGNGNGNGNGKGRGEGRRKGNSDSHGGE